MKLTGQHILITGGSSGIGFELAKQLLSKGNSVIITGRDNGKLEKAKKLLPQVITIQNDVSSLTDRAKLFEKIVKDHPKTNVLVNNAGIMRQVNLHDAQTLSDDFTQEIDINLKAPIHLTKLFMSHLKKMKEAAIVNVSSGLAFVPLPTSPIYCATKAGLHSFTQSLRVQLRDTSVQVFEVAPPATATELLASFDSTDMKGIPIMKVEDMVSVAIKGMEKNQFEIRPGQANALKFMSRVAPEFILKQLSKPVDRMLKTKH